MNETPSAKMLDPDAPAIVCDILHALVAKLNLSLGDVDHAVTQLGEAFEELAHSARDESAPGASQDRVGEQQAIHALQFHDRLDQRLQHVSAALLEVATLLASGSPQADDWQALARQLSEACPIESDKKLFDELLDRPSSSPAAKGVDPTPTGAGEVELF